jgi:hypothetical protein
VASNGDLFVADSASNTIRVLRGPSGTASPTKNEVFASGLTQPFGIAFYPLGPNPEWIYVANSDGVVRFPYKNGDLVGFIGFGDMGAPMARNLLKAGHHLIVYNRARSKVETLAREGAQVADRVADACQGEILITCSPTTRRLRASCSATAARFPCFAAMPFTFP